VPHKKVLIKNFTSLSILQISNYIFPLITLPYLLRVLGPEKFGLMHFAAAFIGYFGLAVDYGFNLSIPREISIHREDKNKIAEIFSSVLILKICLLIISSVILLPLIFYIPLFQINTNIYLLSAILILGQVISPVWFFQGIERMHFITIITISVRALSVILIFIFIQTANDLSLLIFINSSAYVLIGIIGLIIVVSKFGMVIKWQPWNVLVSYLRDGAAIFISSVSISLYTISNVFILGLLAGQTFVGYYSAADKIRLGVQSIFSAVSQTIYPHLASLFKTSINDGLIFVKKTLFKAGTPLLIICTLIFILSEEIILLVAGADYTASIIVLRILAFLPFIIFLSNLAGIQVMINAGYQNQFTKIILTASALSLILSFILVPIYQEVGTSISVLLTEILVTTMLITFLIKKMKINFSFFAK
jgi:polysaccharide transporter, PST family